MGGASRPRSRFVPVAKLMQRVLWRWPKPRTAAAPTVAAMDPARELEFLQRLSLSAAQTLDAASLVDLVIAETTGAMGVDVCSVYLLDDDGTHLRLTATNGLSQAGVGHVKLKIGEGITGAAAADRAPVVVADVHGERRFRWIPGVDQARFVSMCSVPIVSGDRLVGVINVQTDELHHFLMAEVDFLVAIAAQVAGVLERSALHQRLEAQLAQLHRSEEIHRRFTALSLEGAGLDAICAEIALRSSAAVALYDDVGARLAPRREDELPAVLDPDDLAPAARVLAVQAGAVALGSLVVHPHDHADPIHERAIEHGVTVLALELSRERAAVETEHRLRGDLVEELLAEPLDDVAVTRLTERAARLGVRLRRRMWVVVIEPDGPGAEAAMSDPNSSRRLLRAVAGSGSGRHEGVMTVERGGAFIMLIPDPAASTHVERTAEIALREATVVTGGQTFSAGVSGSSGDAGDLYELAEQARLALRVGRRMRATGVSSYRRLGAERLLAAAGNDDDLARYIDEWLGPLIRQEAQGRAAAPLIETIQALTDVSWSLRAAARRLNVHVNTLLYRLQRAREVSGRDLDDPDVRLAFALALRARTMVGDMAVPAATRTRAASTGT